MVKLSYLNATETRATVNLYFVVAFVDVDIFGDLVVIVSLAAFLVAVVGRVHVVVGIVKISPPRHLQLQLFSHLSLPPPSLNSDDEGDPGY